MSTTIHAHCEECGHEWKTYVVGGGASRRSLHKRHGRCARCAGGTQMFLVEAPYPVLVEEDERQKVMF